LEFLDPDPDPHFDPDLKLLNSFFPEKNIDSREKSSSGSGFAITVSSKKNATHTKIVVV